MATGYRGHEHEWPEAHQPNFTDLSSAPPADRRVKRSGSDWPTFAALGLVAAANIVAITNFSLPFLGPAIGFWFLIIYPVYLLYTCSVWRGSSSGERVGYSLAVILLLLMLAGLAFSTALPLLGIARPLDPFPVAVIGDIIVVALNLFRRRYPARFAWRPKFDTITWQESRVVAISGLCVAAAILGTNRVNNSAGDQVSLAAMAGVILTAFLLLYWRQHLRDGMISLSLYLVSLSLLFMTSLRGWFVTGYDVQTEYRVFQLTQTHGRWDISYFHDAYNSCLSITILPTEIAGVAHVNGPYIYKVFFQVIFAVCPILVYAISRRYWSKPISVLAGIFFISLPPFFTDMPFLNRQEIGFIFVAVATLFDHQSLVGAALARAGLLVAALGAELSHYSTMYVFLGILFVACMIQYINGFSLHRRHARPGKHTEKASRSADRKIMKKAIGIGSILVVAAMIGIWGGLITQTSSAVLSDADSSISGLIGNTVGARTGGAAYLLFGGQTLTPQAARDGYSAQTLAERATGQESEYLPITSPPVNVRPLSESSLPLTATGAALSNIGVPVALLNKAVREAAAQGEQLFAVVGIITLLVLGRRRRYVGEEFFALCIGSLVVVALITVLPDLSVDYGVSRAFQQALIFIAPILVAGSLTIFRPLGKVWAPRAAAAVCIGILFSTSGLMPQLLGDFPAQLSLNNSGDYYDVYYPQPEEEAAVTWLADQPNLLRDGVQAESTGPFELDPPWQFTGRSASATETDAAISQAVTDIYPTILRRSSWVILGSQVVRTSQASFTYDGNLYNYVYPVWLLWENKNLVYSNGGAEIYK